MSFVKDTFFGGAEKKAAEKSQEGQLAAIEEARRQFDLTRESFEPAQEAGNLALAKQRRLLGLDGLEAQNEEIQQFSESPAQRFIRKRQERAIVRNASATGNLGGGNVRLALQENAAGNAIQDLNNQFGRLGQVAGQGFAANQNVAQFGDNATRQIQQGITGAANARASGIVDQAKGRRAGIQQLASGFAGGITGGFSGALQGGFGV